MLKLFLWLRYLRKRKIVFLSIAAVTLSTALLIVVSSIFNGFINAFEQSAIDVLGDVVLEPPVKFAKYPRFIEQLEKLDIVEAATARLSANGLIHLGKGNVRAVTIHGVDPVARAEVTAFKQALRKQNDSTAPPSFHVTDFPERIAGFVGLGVITEPNDLTDEYDFEQIEKMIGQQVLLTTAAVVDSASGQDKLATRLKRKPIKFTITNIIHTGVYMVDKMFVYLPIDALQEKIYPNAQGKIADQIQIKLTDPHQTEAALAQIRGVWEIFASEQLGWGKYLIGETDIDTAVHLQSQQIAEIRKQLGLLILIFGVISCSAIVLVFCILYMIVITRQKDIAIIKSYGATAPSVAWIFIGFGGCIGIIGSICGIAAGYVVTRNVNTLEHWFTIIFGLKLWKSSVYMFSKIPNEIDWHLVWPIVLFAIAAATLGALIPAIVAAKTKPVEILRYE